MTSRQIAAKRAIVLLKAQKRLLRFIHTLWQRPAEPLIVGRHTWQICRRIDRAVEDYRNGKSSYIMMVVPFRHGKSDISSRYLPPWFLGRHPDAEVIQTSYAADLSQGFSKDVARILDDPRYHAVFPETSLNPDSNNATERRLLGHTGRLHAVGAGGGATGKGAHLLVVDDLIKNREEAESGTTRQSRWDSLRNDFMSRLAPVHIVLILATRWHPDDPMGRVLRAMDPQAKDYDPHFPQFEVIHYRARQEDGSFLFPQRFSQEWYERQFAIQGRYGSAGLLQGDPTIRGGNMLHVDGIQVVDRIPADLPLRWVRFWDLASSEKERTGDDPDFTAGARCAVIERGGLPWLYVDDVRWCQSEAYQRDKLIRNTAAGDGPTVWQAVESVGGYKDAATTLRKVLRGRSIVHPVSVSVDKVIRMADVEPVMDAGHVVFKRAWWTDAVIEHLSEFPGGAHDDIADGISGGYAVAKARLYGDETFGGGLGRGAVPDTAKEAA